MHKNGHTMQSLLGVMFYRLQNTILLSIAVTFMWDSLESTNKIAFIVYNFLMDNFTRFE
jgi:hypothetical protein